MTYKLIAIDLDGTLLNEDKVITENNISMLKRLIDDGKEIVIATGRSYWSAKGFLENTGLNLKIMANNGNVVRSMVDDDVIFSRYIPKEKFANLINESRKLNLTPVIYVDHYEDGYDLIIELDKDDDRYGGYLSKVTKRFIRMEDVLDYDGNKVLSVCYLSKESDLKELTNTLGYKYEGIYSSHILKSLTKVGPMLEVMDKGATKWHSISQYANMLGVNDKQIVAIGDDMNDIDMLKHSGLGVAMKNSDYEVKQSADIVTKMTNNQDGVSEILRKIFYCDKL